MAYRVRVVRRQRPRGVHTRKSAHGPASLVGQLILLHRGSRARASAHRTSRVTARTTRRTVAPSRGGFRGSGPSRRSGDRTLRVDEGAHDRQIDCTEVAMRCLRVMLVVLAQASVVLATCESPSDQAAVARVRVVADTQCNCASATHHRLYVRCVARTVAAAEREGQVPAACRSKVLHCAARSTCGLPDHVVCLRTTARARITCAIKPRVRACTPPRGGSSCVSKATSCCDAQGCATSSSTTSTTTSPTTTTTTMNLGASVLQHHRNATRDGVYIDPAFTHQAAAAMHRDPTFTATTQGAAYAQPLYVDGGAGGSDRVLVATEENWVYALDAATGAAAWATPLAPPVPLRNLPCGDIDPLGVTGTPVIDAASRTLFLDAMTTPDGGTTKRHLLYALSEDDGSLRAGFPLDVAAALGRLGLTFEADVQGQRGALAVIGGTLYVPYGGLAGDCGAYHGWVLAVPLTNPAALTAWRTAAPAGGVWAPSGVASDGAALYVATGNTAGTTTWGGGEAVIRLAPGAVFSGQPADYFAPPDWRTLDQTDQDVGSSGVVLFDVPEASPAQLAVALGKNGKAYLLDRGNLGGIGNGVASALVASSEIITAPAAYTTAIGTYVVFKGPGAACPGAWSRSISARRSLARRSLGAGHTRSSARWAAAVAASAGERRVIGSGAGAGRSSVGRRGGSSSSSRSPSVCATRAAVSGSGRGGCGRGGRTGWGSVTSG